MSQEEAIIYGKIDRYLRIGLYDNACRDLRTLFSNLQTPPSLELASLMETGYKRAIRTRLNAIKALGDMEQIDERSDTNSQSGKETDPKHDHEQFLGKDEARQYEELTPEKSKERLAKLVPKMDLNSDGQVDELELREHINFMQKRYVVADYNSDGKMDRTEYGCFMHPEDCDHMRDIVVQETVEDIDKDKDGFVDMAEYFGDMYRPDDYPGLKGKEPEWVESEREMFREHRDKDKDGKLNKTLIDKKVLPHCIANIDRSPEVYYTVIKGDFYRYASVNQYLNKYDDRAEAAYSTAHKLAQDELQATDHLRLGVALNYAIFQMQFRNGVNARELAQQAYDAALTMLEEDQPVPEEIKIVLTALEQISQGEEEEE